MALSSEFAKRFLICPLPESAMTSRTKEHLAKGGADWAVNMPPVEAERPPLASRPGVTLGKSLALPVPRYSL